MYFIFLGKKPMHLLNELTDYFKFVFGIYSRLLGGGYKKIFKKDWLAVNEN